MSTIITMDGTEIFYKDWGSGQPIVFSHGWPLSADDWDTQMLFFLNHGFRVIAHDRRGHGRSAQTAEGHDMDHCTMIAPQRPAPHQNGCARTAPGTDRECGAGDLAAIIAVARLPGWS